MAAASAIEELTPHASLEDRRKAEKSRSLKPGTLDHVFFADRDRRDREVLGRALAAFNPITGELDKSRFDAGLIRQLGLIAATNPDLEPEIAVLVADAKNAGVDVSPFDAAKATILAPTSAATVVPSVRASLDWHTIGPNDLFQPIQLPKRMVPGLVRGAVTLLASSPGVGKSALACTFAVAVATGRKEVLGFVPEWCGEVWYLIAEDSRDTILARIQATLRHHGLSTKDLQHPIHLIGGGGGGPVTLFGRAERHGIPTVTPVGALLDREARVKKPGLLIVDTFSAAFAGLDENSASDTTSALGWLGRLALGADAAILLLHHLNKGAEGQADTQVAVRGSSALTASVRAVYGLGPVRDPVKAGVPPGALRLDLLKANNEPTGPVGYFEKSGVNVPAIDPRDPTAIAVLSTVALSPVAPQIAVPSDPLSTVDATAVIAALRGGLSGDPNAFFGATRAAKAASAHTMLAARFKLDGDAADAILKRLEEIGAIRVENRAPPGRGADRARPSVIVADDAEARVASVQPREVTLSRDPSVFD